MAGPGEKAANSPLLLGISLLLNLGLFGFLCAQAAFVGRLSAQVEKLLAAEAHMARFGARIDSLSAQYQAFAKVFARSSARNAPYMPALDMLLYEQGAWFVQMTLERALKKMLTVYHSRPLARHRSTSEESVGPEEEDGPDDGDVSSASASGSGSGSDSDNGRGDGSGRDSGEALDNDSERSSEDARRPTISVSPVLAASPGPEKKAVAAGPNGHATASPYARSTRGTGVSRGPDSR
jgi:hypothetical protein